MGDINKHCPMCGATPGRSCTVISGDDGGPNPGDERPEPHFYRGNDHPIPVLIPDEPPYADS